MPPVTRPHALFPPVPLEGPPASQRRLRPFAFSETHAMSRLRLTLNRGERYTQVRTAPEATGGDAPTADVEVTLDQGLSREQVILALMHLQNYVLEQYGR